MSATRKLVDGNIRAYHKNISQSYINTLDPVVALRWCNPQDRDTFARELYKEDVITKDQAKEFAKMIGV